MQRPRDDERFWAVWEMDRTIARRRRRQTGVRHEERHTIMLVEKPLSERYKQSQGYLGAFWMYLDGFEAMYYYTGRTYSLIRNVRQCLVPASAPEEERFLLALVAGHQLFPMQVERSLPFPLRIQDQGEQVYEGELRVYLPHAPNGWVSHCYTLRQRLWQVTLGEATCDVVGSLYSSDALWDRGLCWQRRIENWSFLPAGEELIALYGRPAKAQYIEGRTLRDL